MIYKIIVDTQPAPPDVRGWDSHVVAELEVDANPEFKGVYPEGHVIRFDLEGDDWSLPAINELIRTKIREDIEERFLGEAREIGAELQPKLTAAYEGEGKLIGHIDLWKGTFTPLENDQT